MSRRQLTHRERQPAIRLLVTSLCRRGAQRFAPTDLSQLSAQRSSRKMQVRGITPNQRRIKKYILEFSEASDICRNVAGEISVLPPAFETNASNLHRPVGALHTDWAEQ